MIIKDLAKDSFQLSEVKGQLEAKTQVDDKLDILVVIVFFFFFQEYQMMLAEVDSMYKAYQDMITQNQRLIVELGQKDDVTMQVASEVSKLRYKCWNIYSLTRE